MSEWRGIDRARHELSAALQRRMTVHEAHWLSPCTPLTMVIIYMYMYRGEAVLWNVISCTGRLN